VAEKRCIVDERREGVGLVTSLGTDVADGRFVAAGEHADASIVVVTYNSAADWVTPAASIARCRMPGHVARC
jgi:hypothetical protein